MSVINSNSIFFSSLDDVSLSPLKLSNLNSQEQVRPRSFPVLLQPELQRPTPFSLFGTTQRRSRTSLLQELDFSFVSNTALKPYSERTSVVIDQVWVRTSETYTEVHFTDKSAWRAQVTKSPQELTPISQRNSPVYQFLDNISESSPIQKHSPVVVNKEWSHISQRSTSTEHESHQQHLDTNQELTPVQQRSPFIINKEWSYNSNTLQGPTPMVECRYNNYSEHGFNRLSHTPQGSSARSSFDADQNWSQMSPIEDYVQLPPMIKELDQIQKRSPVIIPEHEVSQPSHIQSHMHYLTQAETLAATIPLTLNQRLRQEQSNKENEFESKEFACTECDKIYKGKNARSILRRHLKDKHKIEQPRGTRWDNDPNRPKTDEERRQRMLESKRRSALKARERKNNQRAIMQQQSNNGQLGSRQSDLYSASKVELSLILSPPRTPRTTAGCSRNLCSSPAHYHINNTQ